MKKLLTGREMTAADHFTSEVIGIPSLVLMERAALSAADIICENTSAGDHICIIAGPGNNGADGLACGRILLDRGYRVSFYLTSAKAPAENSSMKIQQDILSHYGIHPGCIDGTDFLTELKPDAIVDAIFGTGLARHLTAPLSDLVSQINDYRSQSGCLVLGMDIPSGVSSDDGSVLGCAVKCDITVTFGYYKRGHFLFPGTSYCGKMILSDIGITDRSLIEEPSMFMLEDADIPRYIPRRDPTGHKGTFGRVLLVVGSKGMCGAAILCAKAALAAGAGMVKIFTAEENRVILQSTLPEVMLETYDTENLYEIRGKLYKEMNWAQVLAVGSGIGQTPASRELIRTIVSYINGHNRENHLRCVTFDADALRILAADTDLYADLRERACYTECILTPHLAEFADLMHCDIWEIPDDRIHLLQKLAKDLSCIVIGKDARTFIASYMNNDICLITNGNPGMAAAGSGDVLTGITAALSGYLRESLTAVHTAAYIHAMAGTYAASRRGEYSMTAMDIADNISEVLRNFDR